jgi:3-dehydroquinate dehydratase-1
VTCGGHFKGCEEKRIDYLLNAIDAGCAIVDIEIETSGDLKQRVINRAKEKNCKVIISMHDFKKTPDRRKLLEMMHREREEGADIGKIVTMANSKEDCHRILGLLLEAKKENFPLLAFAMGDLGRFTRIVALLYGAPFMYVSFGEKGESGQLSVDTTRKILKELMR